MASNVIPFQQRHTNIGYSPGVVPFDISNPAHVHAWNMLFQLSWSGERFLSRERVERTTSLESA